MTRTQFRILYRQFLFRMVDVELLSADAQGDLSKLFGQFTALLIFLSLGLAILGFGVGGAGFEAPAQLVATWSGEHFLIATTMLVVGLFAVLSWDSTFPDKSDVFVLAPLPVRTRTLFLAKIAAVATGLSVTVVALHVAAGLVWPFALDKERPAVAAPAITSDPAIPPVSAKDMEGVLKRDLAQALKIGPLAPGTGGGVSIGVWKKGAGRVFAYGAAKPQSILQIGSISKTFTGLLLAQMVAQGRVRLNEPVRDLLPPETVSHPAGAEITLLDLATHRSGLPPMPDNFNRNAEPNPLADYTADDLYAYVAKRGIAKPPRVPFNYSNLGGGLLGTALANHAGTSYEDLLQQEIAGPLGMEDTTISVPQEEQGLVLPSYVAGHRQSLPWNLGPLAGAGAICSSAGNMLKYLEAFLHPERISNAGTLPEAIRMARLLRADVQPGMRIALFWMYNDATGIYWHNGLVGGYESYAFFDPKNDSAGIVLFNMANAYGFADTLGEHIRARLAGTSAISMDEAVEPARGGVPGLVRVFAVYWITMLTAGAFIFCCVLGAQGIIAQLLPRQIFLRMSSFLQLAAFALFIAVYFLEPKLVTPGSIAVEQSHAYLEWSPTYWFLGLFQQLNGSPALAPLARRAWIGLAVAFSTTAVAYSLAYLRTMRKIVEAPDIVSGSHRVSWLPNFGNSFETAVGQFSFRTVLRSRQHRLMVAFYLGVGFAATILFPQWPVMRELSEEGGAGWSAGVGLPVLGSTVLVMCLCVLATRVAFSLPMDLRANWIFRLTLISHGKECLGARRRAFYALSVAPVWTGSAAVLFCIWPWQAAVEHLLVLAVVGAAFAELGLYGTQKLPFTCSYLPGKSHFHMTFLLCTGAVLSLIAKAVQLERRTFEDARSYAMMVATLTVLAISIWWRNTSRARSPEGEVRFEEAANPAILGLNLNRDGVTPIPSERGSSDATSSARRGR